jgi:hypothetical protein
MTTTKHPTIESAERIIRRASVLLEDKWHRSTEHDRGYGIGDALIEAAEGDRVALVVAERQLAHHELDVWWNDLVCGDALSLRGRALRDRALCDDAGRGATEAEGHPCP